MRLSRQKLRNEPPEIINNKRRKAWYLPQFRKNVTKNQDYKLWKHPTHRLVDDNHTRLRVFRLLTKKPPKNERHTPRGGRRTRYLVLVVVVVAVVGVVVVVVVAVVVVAIVVAVVVAAVVVVAAAAA